MSQPDGGKKKSVGLRLLLCVDLCWLIAGCCCCKGIVNWKKTGHDIASFFFY